MKPEFGLKIITCADSAFYRFLPALERNIKMRQGDYPVVYDLGTTPRQISSLKSLVVTIKPPDGYNENTEVGNVKATHKSDCVLNFLNRFDEDCLYLVSDIGGPGAPRDQHYQTLED